MHILGSCALTALFVGSLLASCGQENNSSDVTLSLAISLDTTSTTTSASAKKIEKTATSAVAIDWHRVDLAVNEIKLRADSLFTSETASSSTQSQAAESSSSANEDGSSGMARFTGTWIFDLLRNTSNPPLEDLELAKGAYGFAQIKSQKGLLDTPSVVLEGTATLGETSDIPVYVALELTDIVTFSAKNLLTIDTDTRLQASFDADAWFAGVDWTACYDMDAGTLTMTEASSGTCADARKTLEKNIKKGGILEKVGAQ